MRVKNPRVLEYARTLMAPDFSIAAEFTCL